MWYVDVGTPVSSEYWNDESWNCRLCSHPPAIVCASSWSEARLKEEVYLSKEWCSDVAFTLVLRRASEDSKISIIPACARTSYAP